MIHASQQWGEFAIRPDGHIPERGFKMVFFREEKANVDAKTVFDLVCEELGENIPVVDDWVPVTEPEFGREEDEEVSLDVRDQSLPRRK